MLRCFFEKMIRKMRKKESEKGNKKWAERKKEF